MDTQRLLNKIQSFIDFILGIFGNRFKGYRMLIGSAGLGVFSIINYYTGFITDRLCIDYAVMCDPKSAQWFSVFTLFIGIVGYVSRKLIDMPAGDLTGQFFKRFTSHYKDEVQRLRRRL